MYFSEGLVKKYQEYFRKKGKEFSDDETQDGLNSIADLYKFMGELIASKKNKNNDITGGRPKLVIFT